MSGNDYTPAPKEELRLRAVLALFKGETVAQVSAQFGMSRSSLFDYKRRALAAMGETLKDRRRGPRRPRNRIPVEKEQAIRSVCERHPTLSSYQVKEQLGGGAPTPRTIQRVRKRLSLPRLKKRLPPSTKAHRFTRQEKQTIKDRIEEKMHLGPHRLAWDIQNRDHIPVGPSTISRVKEAILEEMNPRPPKPVWKFYERKHPHSLWHGDFLEKVVLTRGGKTAYQFTLLDDYSRAYVYCGLFTEADEVNVVRALITAMRQYQTIPKALLFDNGRCFRGNLITALCRHLGINLIHTSSYDRQTVCLTDTLDGLEVRAPDGKVFLLPKYRKLCKPTYPTPPRLHLFGRRKLAPITADERRVFYEEGGIVEADSPAIAVAQ